MTNNKKTDYERFCDAALELGMEQLGRIGKLEGRPGESLHLESWYIPGPGRKNGEGFFLIHNKTNGTIGIYQFVGDSGAGIESDLQWLVRKYQQVQDGRGGKNSAQKAA